MDKFEQIAWNLGWKDGISNQKAEFLLDFDDESLKKAYNDGLYEGRQDRNPLKNRENNHGAAGSEKS